MKYFSEPSIERANLCVQTCILIALIVTAIFVIRYWCETQEMKKEMITQNKLSSQALKASFLPVIDVYFKKVGEDYDIILENKGNGPAFRVFVQRSIISDNKCSYSQKRGLIQTKKGKIGGFSENITIIGRGEQKKVRRERSDSYKCVRITIGYYDLTGKDFHKSIFEGNRDGLKMIDNPLLKDYQHVDKEHS